MVRRSVAIWQSGPVWSARGRLKARLQLIIRLASNFQWVINTCRSISRASFKPMVASKVLIAVIVMALVITTAVVMVVGLLNRMAHKLEALLAREMILPLLIPTSSPIYQNIHMLEASDPVLDVNKSKKNTLRKIADGILLVELLVHYS